MSDPYDLESFAAYDFAVRRWPCGQLKTVRAHGDCSVCKQIQGRDHSGDSSEFTPPSDPCPVEPMRADRFEMEFQPNYDAFRDTIASAWTCKRLLASWIKDYPSSTTPYTEYTKMVERLWSGPKMKHLEELILQSDDLFKNYLVKNPTYGLNSLSHLKQDTTSINYSRPQSDLDYQVAWWFDKTMPDFANYVSDVLVATGNLHGRVSVYCTDEHILQRLMALSAHNENIVVSRSDDYADIYVFSPNNYSFSSHRKILNAWGFGWTANFLKPDLGDCYLEYLDSCGNIRVTYKCRGKKGVEPTKRTLIMPYFGGFGDVVPNTRAGFKSSLSWDAPEKAKASRGRDGMMARGGTWSKNWCYRTGVMYTIAVGAHNPITFGPSAYNVKTKTQLADLHGLRPCKMSYESALGFPKSPGDMVAHWAVSVSPAGARLILAVEDRVFTREAAGVVARNKGYDITCGWGVLRGDMLINPYAYADSRLKGFIVDAHFETAHVLSFFGNVQYVTPQRVSASDSGMWMYPCANFFLMEMSKLKCPILSSGYSVFSMSEIGKYYAPPVGGLAWLSFLIYAGLEAVVPDPML